MAASKIGICDLNARKQAGQRIHMLTAYDYPSARLLDEAGVDCILVGDSLGNVVLGYRDTVPVTLAEMIHHTRAVCRGVAHALTIGDLPFGSYQATAAEAVRSASRLLKRGGCDAVKLEGGGAMADTVAALVRAGIPVVGHLGLTPQSATLLGGYKVQGRTAEGARRLIEHAVGLEAAGAFLLVLECVPDRVAELITKRLRIPVIGIGAGPHCDGQVLVLHDMLGIQAGFTPKFCKRYETLGDRIGTAVRQFCADVQTGQFPAAEHSFAMTDEEFEKI